VGTAFGLEASTDQGATWTLTDAFGGADPRVISVAAQSSGILLAGGPAGIRRSPDSGATWFWPSSGNQSVWDIHAFGRSPYSSSQAYISSAGTQLFYTEDAGDHWTQIASAPGGGGGCGGISFIKPIARTVFRRRPFAPLHVLDLYYGNRCSLS